MMSTCLTGTGVASTATAATPVVMRREFRRLPWSWSIEGKVMSSSHMASGRFLGQESAPNLCGTLCPDVPAALRICSSVQWDRTHLVLRAHRTDLVLNAL
jgi:hypothetical protein